MCIEDCSKIQVDKKFFFIDFSLVEQIMSTAVSLFLAILQEAPKRHAQARDATVAQLEVSAPWS